MNRFFRRCGAGESLNNPARARLSDEKHPRRVTRKFSGGFTLIEVLIALFVVATALAALGYAGAQALGNQGALEERTLALWAADNQIAETRLQPSLQPGISSGSVRTGNRDWRWRRQIQLAPGGQLWRIDVTILDGDDQPIYVHTGFEQR